MAKVIKPKRVKAVRVTIELPNRFVGLLNAKAKLSGWIKHATGAEDAPQMDAGSFLAFLVLMEARGATEEQIHFATPTMWRDANSPVALHDRREVIFDA